MVTRRGGPAEVGIGRAVLNYRITGVLGAGGMGVVYRALDTRLGRNVALKFLPATFGSDEEARERLVREARAAAQLDHPNIGVIHSIEGLEAEPFIVMAFYPGESLKARLERGPLGLDEALDICLQAARGLAAAHASGVLHRDIKPANLLLTPDGLVKILDFGLARLTGSGDLTRTGELLGTPEYMSPEQVRGQGLDPRSDLWSLGVVFYEMLTGVSPFRVEGLAATILQVLGKDPLALGVLRPDLPATVQELVAGMLAKDRERRHGSALELIARLEALRDRSEPARGHEAMGARLDVADRPPAASVPKRRGTDAALPPHVLPRPAMPLVGRQDELAVIALNLADPHCRLLTLVGSGGAGKTRLALEAAAAELPLGRFPDGVFFVPLDALADPALVPAQIADTLGLELRGQDEVLVQTIRHLADKRLLLVLDNYEHLVSGATLAADLLRGCPDLTLLVTSRQRLDLEEEWVFPLQGLPVPREVPATMEEALRSEAVQLFVQRARRAKLGYALDPDELPHICRTCQLLEGLPLGLELAAAWIGRAASAEIVREIEANLDFLTSSSRNAPQRHKSLRATFEYSWTLLGPAEQEVLRRLAVFRGGFSAEAARDVAEADLPMLASLVDKSLLRLGPSGRYDRHPLLHQYMQEKLAERPSEQTETEARHGRYFHRLLQSLSEELRSGQQAEALAAVERELDNVRAAWQWAVAGSQAEELRQSCRSLQRSYDLKGRNREADEAFARAAAALDDSKPAHQAALGELLGGRAFACFRLGRYAEAEQLAERGLGYLRPQNSGQGIMFALNTLASIAYQQGNYDRAKQYWQELVDEAKTHGSGRDLATSLGNLALADESLGNYSQAAQYQREALALNRRLGHRTGIASGLSNLGNLLLSMDRPTEAQPLLEEGLQLAQDGNFQLVIAPLLQNLGETHRQLGDIARARSYYQDALQRVQQSGERWREAVVLAELGRLAATQTHYQEAHNYYRQSLQLGWSIQMIPAVLQTLLGLAELYAQEGHHEKAVGLVTVALQHPAIYGPAADDAQKLLAAWQDKLSTEAMAAAQEWGRTLPLEEVVAQILR